MIRDIGYDLPCVIQRDFDVGNKRRGLRGPKHIIWPHPLHPHYAMPQPNLGVIKPRSPRKT
jgi:hypothetical protein